MADEAIVTPEVEAKTPAEAPTEPKEETVGEVLKTETQPEKEKPVIGLDKFLDLKKENKQFRKDIEELKSKIEEGASKVEVSADLETLAEEHNIDPKFLAGLTNAIKAQVRQETEAEIKPLKEKEKADSIDKAFSTHYNKAIKNMPELEGIVNKDVIKSLSLDPKNSNKTFTQLIEEAYGNVNVGKRTIETTTPRGGKEPEPVDLNRANRDESYLNEVLSNPQSAKEYNDMIMRSIRL